MSLCDLTVRRCHRCDGGYVWAATSAGVAYQVDAVPAAGGTLVLHDRHPGVPPVAEVVPERLRQPGGVLYVPHAMTCGRS